MPRENKNQRVCIYGDAAHCSPGGGMHLRLRSNVLAFHDLGWHVEAVLLGNEGTVPEWAKIEKIDWIIEKFTDKNTSFVATNIEKMAYRLGYPGAAACRYLFPKHDAVRAAVAKRAGQGSLHLFEGLMIANALPFVAGGFGEDKFIFSQHDIWHEGTLATRQAHHEIENRSLEKPEIRELRFLRRIESLLYAKSDMVLTISARDCRVVREEGWKNVEHLPMSVDESAPVRRSAPDDGLFRILHLGRVGHLPSYRSLEFLLRDVLPLLGQDILSRVRIRVVGKIEKEDPLVQRILKLREPFAPQVEMVGYVPDILEEFAGNDIQIAAPTAASGLQTRIVESFARGLPVIASEMAARGLESPVHRKNLLIAKNAEELAAAITDLAVNRGRILELSTGGRRYYERNHSRAQVAKHLERHLSRLGL